ncbi:alpha-amylase domain-containing protein [Haloarchaeobius sp. TZWSO28]|uniref:alpha-amylase domain-containing protein n=1 Tax=Haloarchaeobius sp. TZWSO28 TaxID=3446119 RepID=UPI003EB8FD32
MSEEDSHTTATHTHDQPTTTRRGALRGIGAAILGTAGGAAALSANSEPVSAAAGEDAVLQYYHTPWTEITGNMSKVADAGYAAIQVPPPQKSKLSWDDQDENNHPPLGYQPIDNDSFDSAFGTEAEYREMISTAHQHGVEVYADIVLNHMAYIGDGEFDFPEFSRPDFHDCRSIDDWDDQWQVENCDLLGLKDLEQESSYVRGELKEYMGKIADCGADGLRYDAAKHVPKWFWRDYANQWADEFGLDYRVAEVFHSDLNYVEPYADTGMSVTDYPLYNAIQGAFSDGGSFTNLDGAGVVNQNPFAAQTFVANHDSGFPQYTDLARAFVLTYEGYPRLYKAGLDDSYVNQLLWIRNNLCGGPAYTRYVDDDLYIYERYQNVLVGLNKTDQWRGEWVYTGWTDTTLKDYSGSAADETVNSDGWVQVWFPPKGYAAFAPY